MYALVIITVSGIVAHFAGENVDFGGIKCILARLHARVIFQTALLSFSTAFTNSIHSKVIIIVI